VDGQEVSATASAGICLFPEDGEDAPTLVRNAFTSISRAREQGRNNLQFYRADLNAKMAERFDFETDLRRALEHKEFLLHYQPQIDLKTKRICGMEALLRWRHPQRGLLMPHDFLPLLEETGLIVPLGAWLLRTACEQNSTWQATGLPAVPVAVNFSYQQLGEPDYIDQIAQILEETGLAPRFLHLDISDRILSREARATQEALGKLNSMSIGLVADDFIVGDSSLRYLKRLPVNGLKIDASLLLRESDNTEEAVMTGAIVSIAHKQQLRVMADGVETEQQLHFLQAAGCDVVQGRVFGQPLPAMEVTRLLQSGELVKP
jgi:EAL domain-containing protein (putative c-di-GMP-specific phosphodiesterase class I)